MSFLVSTHNYSCSDIHRSMLLDFIFILPYWLALAVGEREIVSLPLTSTSLEYVMRGMSDPAEVR